MKDKRLIIVLAGIIAVCLLLWFLSHGPRGSFAAAPKPSPGQAPTAQTAPIPAKAPLVVPKEQKKQLPEGPYEPSDPRWQKVRELDKTDKQWEWKTPIEFYGRVIDSGDHPVPGAQIHFVWNDTSAEGSSMADTVSDGAGLFSLSGVRGKVLSVYVQKDGYYTFQQGVQRSFDFAAFWDKYYYEPDAKNPVIFRLRKKAQAEPLVVRSGLYGFPNNGAPIYWDLKTGKRSRELIPDADIAVRVLRGQPVNNRYDWSVVIEGVNGTGLVESNEEFMFTAPAGGYQSKVEVKQEASASDWKSDLQRNFYVNGQNGRFYARIEADMIPSYGADTQAAFNAKVYVNPSGSRNLEYDPAKQIDPQ